MAHLNRHVTLKLWPNKDADVEEVSLDPSETLTVVETWERLALVKDSQGRMFNVARDWLES